MPPLNYTYPDALKADCARQLSRFAALAPVGSDRACLLWLADGTPQGVCEETAPQSGKFKREYSKATVELDCGSWESTITMKKA